MLSEEEKYNFIGNRSTQYNDMFYTAVKTAVVDFKQRQQAYD